MLGYAESGGGKNNRHNAFILGLTCMFSPKDQITLRYSFFNGDARNVPSDMNTEKLKKTRELAYMSSLTYGRVIYSPFRQMRVVMRAGIHNVSFRHPVNYVQRPKYSWVWNSEGRYYEPTYDYSYARPKAWGITLNPVVEFPVLRWVGISAGAYAHFNYVQTIAGVEATVIVGSVRHFKKNKGNFE
jgi:hypothetical protein